MYINEPLKKYIDELAARQPTPGGGSAASLTGALGVALLEMVCNFTIGNKKYKDIEEVVVAHLGVLKKIREEFMALIDEDVKVYGSICSAFKTKDEKIIDKALKDGYYISLKICKLSKSGIDVALVLASKSNINLITDVGCGAELLKASFNSGVLNSEINLKGIKDISFAERERSVINNMKNDIEDLYEMVISKASERMA
nr:cyclodeaminase/cyclohydrolase family protein [Candidatus Omnitrophota bacterium]